MRTLPVVAAQEVRIEDANARWHLQPSQFRADLVQRQVAMKAQAEWPRATRQVEALVQFAQLQRRVRYPERLDHVLDRRRSRALTSEGLPPPFGRQEIVEYLVEAEGCTGHVEQNGRAAGLASLGGQYLHFSANITYLGIVSD